jgi:hypothetical protein
MKELNNQEFIWISQNHLLQPNIQGFKWCYSYDTTNKVCNEKVDIAKRSKHAPK